MNSSNIPPRQEPSLIEGSFAYKSENKEKTLVTQHIKIGDKLFSVKLLFQGSTSEEQTKNVLNANLEKITDLIAAFKLGKVELNQTTMKLKLNKDKSVVRTYKIGKDSTAKIETIKRSSVDKTIQKSKIIATSIFQPEKIKTTKEIEVPPKDKDLESYEKSDLSQPLLGAAVPNDSKKHFEYKFKDDSGNPVATEHSERVETVLIEIEGLKSKRADIEKKLKSLGADDTDKQKKLNLELEAIDKRLTAFEENAKDATWASTNSPRFIFQAFGREGAKGKNLPILINLRMQTVEGADGTQLSAVSRSGAISDFSHGETSLQELKDYQFISEYPTLSKKAFDENDSKAKEHLDMLMSSIGKRYNFQERTGEPPLESLGRNLNVCKRNLEIKALIAYGPEALCDPTVDKTKIKDVVEQLVKNQWITKSGTITAEDHDMIEMIKTKGEIEKKPFDRWTQKDDNFMNDAINMKKIKLASERVSKNGIISINDILASSRAKVTLEKLNNIVKERENFLKQQALQDLYIHFKTKPVTGPHTIYTRVSLLDVTKNAKDDYGCILHERSQALDMKALLDSLDGQKIVFDVAKDGGPFIDDEGLIHMPEEFKRGDLVETQLNTLFFNISVQGNTVNSGLQKVINDEALEKLEKLCVSENTHLNKLKEGLTALAENKSDPFESALAATRTILDLGGYSGVNCYGGKDRTGYLMALNTHSILKDNEADNSTLKRWGRELLSKAGVAANTAKQNADHIVMKLMRYDLSLYDTKSWQGVALRMYHYIQSGYLAVIGKISLFTSEAPGQLYKAQADALKKHKIKIIGKYLTDKVSSVSQRVSSFVKELFPVKSAAYSPLKAAL